MAGKGRDPLEIFPAEIWEILLEQLRKEVGSSRDVLNCSKVCTEFERILEPTKQEWLFGSICPFIFPYLEGGELLHCRRICKNWRRGVDTFLEDFETWRPFDEGTSDISRTTEYDPLKQKGIKWTEIWNERRLVIFLEGMKKQRMKTPFIGRSLSLPDFYFERNETEFFERVLEMFRLYGDHIWHLNFEQSMEACQFYQFFKQMLSCTPVLKSLTFHMRLFGTFDEDTASKLKSLFEDHSLPEINSLETLEIQTSRLPPGFIFEQLITKINVGNLKCLKLQNMDYNVEPYAVVTPLQHLSEFHLSGVKWADLEHILNNMISPTAPLAKLSLDLNGVFNIAEINLDRACIILNKWKGTLRMLAIKGKTDSDFGEAGPNLSLSKLDAVNLKSLELEGILFGRGFLSPALTASLEYLHIRYNGQIRLLFGPGMEFYQSVFDAAELHNSSIWDEMKKLKIIRVQRPFRFIRPVKVICTREMHERGIQPKFDIINKIIDSDDEVDDEFDYIFLHPSDF